MGYVFEVGDGSQQISFFIIALNMYFFLAKRRTLMISSCWLRPIQLVDWQVSASRDLQPFQESSVDFGQKPVILAKTEPS